MSYSIKFSEEQWSELRDGLWARDDVESAAVVLSEPVRSPEAGVAALVAREIAVPATSDYHDRRCDFLELAPTWINRCCRRARECGWGVVTVHTHLHAGPTAFSWADDRGDDRLLPAMYARVQPAPVGSMVLSRDDCYARVLDGGERRDGRVTVAGRRLTIFPRTAPGASLAHNRQILALGPDGHAALASLRVGVVGLGGTGSVVHTLLRHLGVRSVVVCDPDVLDESNRSRVIGSRLDDRPGETTKLSIAARVAEAIQGDAAVELVKGTLDDERAARAFVGCDVVFSCVDRLGPRALLNQLAYAAHLPVIDMGSAFRVDETGAIVSQGGKVAIIGPGRPCLWCWGDLDPDRLREESLPANERAALVADGYVQGTEVAQPSVVAFNAQLASAAVVEAMRMVTGFAGAADPPDRLNFDFARGTATRARGRACLPCTFCRSRDGGRAPVTQSMPVSAGS